MTTLRTLFLLLVFATSVNASTVSFRATNFMAAATGPITFQISQYNGPFGVSPSLVIGKPLRIVTTNGLYSTNMLAGRYDLSVSGYNFASAIIFNVPDDTNTYNVVDLITNGVSFYTNTPIYNSQNLAEGTYIDFRKVGAVTYIDAVPGVASNVFRLTASDDLVISTNNTTFLYSLSGARFALKTNAQLYGTTSLRSAAQDDTFLLPVDGGGVRINSTSDPFSTEVFLGSTGITAAAFSGSGAGLTGLNGTNVSDGTIHSNKLGASLLALIGTGSGAATTNASDLTTGTLSRPVNTTGSVVSSGGIMATNADDYTKGFTAQGTAGDQLFVFASTGEMELQTGSTATGLEIKSGQALRLGTWQGGVAMQVSSSGKVGLGSTNPAAVLTSDGPTRLTRSAWIGNARNQSKIYSEGDSLTAADYYQPMLMTLLSLAGNTNWAIYNEGLGGSSTTDLLGRITNSVLNSGDAEYVLILCGINDVVSDVSSNTIKLNLQAVYDACAGSGFKVVALTITPFGDSLYWSAARQATLEGVNDYILNEATNVDFTVDAYTATADPGDADALLPAYASADGLHWNLAGGYAVATNINTSCVFTQLPLSSVALTVVGGATVTGNLTALGTSNYLGTLYGDGSGLTGVQTAQTNISYTAVTNAPWGLPQTNISYVAVTNAPWGLPQTNISYAAVTNAPWGLPQTNISYVAVTNAPWANTNNATEFASTLGAVGNLTAAGSSNYLASLYAPTGSVSGTLSIGGAVGSISGATNANGFFMADFTTNNPTFNGLVRGSNFVNSTTGYSLADTNWVLGQLGTRGATNATLNGIDQTYNSTTRAFTLITSKVQTNAWALDTAFPMNTNKMLLTSGAVTGGMTGVSQVAAVGAQFGELLVKATGDITFTNPAAWVCNDGVDTRKITNGNIADIAVQVTAFATNLIIVQSW